MSKKNFRELGETAAAQFISTSNGIQNDNNTDETHDTSKTDEMPNVSGMNEIDKPQEKSIEKQKKADKYYRFNLKIPIEYKYFLDEAAWKERKTITQYISDLIKNQIDKEIKYSE